MNALKLQMKETQLKSGLNQGLANFSYKGTNSKDCSFGGVMRLLVSTQLCVAAGKQPQTIHSKGAGPCSNKTQVNLGVVFEFCHPPALICNIKSGNSAVENGTFRRNRLYLASSLLGRLMFKIQLHKDDDNMEVLENL